VKVIACIEDPAVIKQILDYLQKHSESAHPLSLSWSSESLLACLHGN